ncbi:vitamin B12 dependent-methionine synthase activation domain-containing protein [Wukongibacter baidiensis]|uniref:vitamin B12 dependent-methionine synthase activation domain-containing protein n=1 Tax=Wukongibacter baidiensis TaxID=1723361 RepID=UPI003D7F9134
MTRHLEYNMINKKDIDLVIDKNEVLRYLGYGKKEADEITDGIIDECLEEISEIARTNFVYNIYEIKREEGNIYFKNSKFKIEGKDIYKHLQNSEKCAIMAVTLGNEVDKRIRYYSKVNLTKSVIFDACATAGIEALCDRVESEVKKIAINNGYNITSRYSPGYGDLSIEIQPKILNLLDAQKHIGLTVTDSYILIPRKSVTALIGIGEEVKVVKLSCKDCRLHDNCLFAKEGDSCGNTKTARK